MPADSPPFTPQPWEAMPLPSGKWVIIGPPDLDSSGGRPVVATVEHSAPYPASQAEAEARLIAAAPALLAACRMMEPILVDIDKLFKPGFPAELKQLRAAIAAASARGGDAAGRTGEGEQR